MKGYLTEECNLIGFEPAPVRPYAFRGMLPHYNILRWSGSTPAVKEPALPEASSVLHSMVCAALKPPTKVHKGNFRSDEQLERSHPTSATLRTHMLQARGLGTMLESPPSITYVCPVTKPACSLKSHSAKLATSAGCPMRPNGCICCEILRLCGLPTIDCAKVVSVAGGNRIDPNASIAVGSSR